MKRYSGNPILSPIVEHPWESRQVFNAAAIYLDGKVHLLYRAMGNDNISRVGYATSSDGFTIDEHHTRFMNPGEEKTALKTRITQIDDKLVMLYTALRAQPYTSLPVALTTITKQNFLDRKWDLTPRKLPFAASATRRSTFPQKSTADTLCSTESNQTLHSVLRFSAVVRHIVGDDATSPGLDNWKIGVSAHHED